MEKHRTEFLKVWALYQWCQFVRVQAIRSHSRLESETLRLENRICVLTSPLGVPTCAKV